MEEKCIPRMQGEISGKRAQGGKHQRPANEEKKFRLHFIPWNVTKLHRKKLARSFSSSKRNGAQYFFICTD